MERAEFLKICGGACLGVLGISVLSQCATSGYVQSSQTNGVISFSKTNFIRVKEEKTTYKKFVIVRPETSTYPIVVYRTGEDQYTALLMRCTHQGNELNVHGDLLSCAAHGSEFAKDGSVITGPAEQTLKTYPVTFDQEQIYIHTLL